MGAVAAKELRYLWREPILRAQRISAGVLIGGTVVAVLVVPTLRRPEFVLAPAFLVWWFSVGALNQFAIDRSAYWMNVAAAGDPRDDLLGKNIALAIANVPLFTILAVVIAIVTKGWGYLPVAVANEAGLLAVMFAVGNVTSVRLAQPAPESPMNLWASRPGQGCGTAALMMVALLLNLLLIGPVAGLVAAGLKLWRRGPPRLWRDSVFDWAPDRIVMGANPSSRTVGGTEPPQGVAILWNSARQALSSQALAATIIGSTCGNGHDRYAARVGHAGRRLPVARPAGGHGCGERKLRRAHGPHRQGHRTGQPRRRDRIDVRPRGPATRPGPSINA